MTEEEAKKEACDIIRNMRYGDDMQAEMTLVKAEIEDQFVTLCIGIIAVAVVMALIGSIIARSYGNKICKSLDKIQNMASRLSEGDLTTPIEVKDRS